MVIHFLFDCFLIIIVNRCDLSGKQKRRKLADAFQINILFRTLPRIGRLPLGREQGYAQKLAIPFYTVFLCMS